MVNPHGLCDWCRSPCRRRHPQLCHDEPRRPSWSTAPPSRARPMSEVMDLIISALYMAQQKFFFWLSCEPREPPLRLPDPKFQTMTCIIEELTMKTFKGTAPPKLEMPHSRQRRNPRRPQALARPIPPNLRTTFSLTPHLQKRYQDSGSPALTPMMGPDQIKKVPKAGKDAICLAWALQGKCRTGCERRSNQPSAQCHRQGQPPRFPGQLPRHLGPLSRDGAGQLPNRHVELHCPTGPHSREEPQVCAQPFLGQILAFSTPQPSVST